jgi:hypothetical protein
MKKVNKETLRMQMLAGIITEGQYKTELNEVTRFPKEWTNEGGDEEENIVNSWSAPMEGWDEEHRDTIQIIEDEHGLYYYVEAIGAFADTDKYGPFAEIEIAEKFVVKLMKEFMSDWNEDEY